MECFPAKLLDSLRGLLGLPDVFSAGFVVENKRSGGSTTGWPPEGKVPDPGAARLFVANRVADGADYIKMIADPPTKEASGFKKHGGVNQPSMNALVAAAKQYEKLTIAHTITSPGLIMALDVNIDIVTHASLAVMPNRDREEDSVIARIYQKNHVGDYKNAETAVTKMRNFDVPALVGIDCNEVVGVPFSPRFGESLHRELELLKKAGFSRSQALASTTRLPGQYFKMISDRGTIEPGKRADLVLLSEDPLVDIKHTTSIQRVWLAGYEFCC